MILNFNIFLDWVLDDETIIFCQISLCLVKIIGCVMVYWPKFFIICSIASDSCNIRINSSTSHIRTSSWTPRSWKFMRILSIKLFDPYWINRCSLNRPESFSLATKFNSVSCATPFVEKVCFKILTSLRITGRAASISSILWRVRFENSSTHSLLHLFLVSANVILTINLDII